MLTLLFLLPLFSIFPISNPSILAASLGNMIAGPLGAIAFTAGAFFLGKKNNFRNPGMQFSLIYVAMLEVNVFQF